MDDIDYFKATYGLADHDLLLVPYGSRVYGTHKEDSDYDYMAIVPANRRADTGTEYRRNDVNIHIYNRYDFLVQLGRHKIHTLEAYFLPDSPVVKDGFFKLKLDLVQLRRELSEKASHSFVKAKKKIDKEGDYYVGWKSLFHSLRILTFGIQIATDGKITDYGAANQHWFDIRDAQQYNWAYFKEKYQPIYNQLATDFRKLAPKE
jgi:predicted nucleotidyltransferase